MTQPSLFACLVAATTFVCMAPSFANTLLTNKFLISQPEARHMLQQEIRILSNKNNNHEEVDGLHLLIFAGEDIESQREAAHVLLNSNGYTCSSYWSQSIDHKHEVQHLANEVKNHFLYSSSSYTSTHHDTDNKKQQQHQQKPSMNPISSTCSIIVVENTEQLSADSLEMVIRPIHSAHESRHFTKDRNLVATILDNDVEIPPLVMFVFLFDLTDPLTSHMSSTYSVPQLRESLPDHIRYTPFCFRKREKKKVLYYYNFFFSFFLLYASLSLLFSSLIFFSFFFSRTYKQKSFVPLQVYDHPFSKFKRVLGIKSTSTTPTSASIQQ
jgi:hypothetical protein